ncbi:MAG: hydrogenase maturation nickel metallochaperone HypA [Planctomycetota bacterium]
MHELSVARDICRSVAEHADGRTVEELTVQVGALSCVNPDALDFALTDVAEAEGVALGRWTIEPVPARARCECGHEYHAHDLVEPCPRCGGFERDYIGGDTVVVSRLVVVEQNGEAD